VLDTGHGCAYTLNMFKQEIARGRSSETRASILGGAISLFRERGFDATTMRDVADAAEVAIGAAYYYFPGKEAIVQAYYDDVQKQHAVRVASALGEGRHDFEERLRIAFHAKFEILAQDRKILGALFRYTADPGHPLSAFGPATRATREASIQVFAMAVGKEKLPEDIGEVLPIALWALHMCVLLYFIYDDSTGQTRTHKLIDGVIPMIARALSLARLPIMKPLRGSLVSLMREAGLYPKSNFRSASIHEEV
jgi:AcrR family transcriptional regulator